MTSLSPLRLKKTAETLLVANNPTYVVRKVVEQGYARSLALRSPVKELVSAFNKAARRSNFERFDDATMILTYIALAFQGELKRVANIQPRRKPKMFDGIKLAAQSLIVPTRSVKVTIPPKVINERPGPRPKDTYQSISIGTGQ
jgi:hypothetical protein